MPLPWLRLYSEFATDPFVQVMTEQMQRRLIMVFCFMQSGDLDKLDEQDLASAMGISMDELTETKKVFLKKGLIEKNWHPSKWKSRQNPDVGAAERMRNMRRNKAVTDPSQDRNVTRHTRGVDGDMIEDLKERDRDKGGVGGKEEEKTIQGERKEEERGNRNVTDVLRPCYGNVTNGDHPGPEFDQLGDLAIQMSCDLSIGSWVLNMARLGYTVEMVRFALEQGASAGQWGHQWLHGILRRLVIDGIPAAPKSKGTPVAMPKPRKPDLTPEERAAVDEEARRNVGY